MNITLNLIHEEEDSKGFSIIADGTKAGEVWILVDFEDADGWCYVERIDIDEEFRNKGIGTQVLTRTLFDTCGWECRTVVVAPDNEDAKRLYERIGEDCIYTDFGYYDQGYGVYKI